MIIDSTYFKGPVSIAQLGQASVVSDLNNYIHRYETEFLQKVLGYALSASFTEGVDVGSDETIEEKYDKLLTGTTFTSLSGRSMIWNGFANDNKAITSPIASYVFYHYIRDISAPVTGSGTAKPNTENSTTVSPMQKMITVWNEMIEQLQVLWQYLNANSAIYPEYNLWEVDFKCFGCYGNQSGKQNIFGV